jgi:HSP20 family protein
MESVRTVQLRWLRGDPSQIAFELTRFRFSQFARPEGWQPAVNAYRCDCSIQVCFDLAGVERADIELRVEPRRLLLRGARPAPEPSEPQPRQILAMEIDSGPFVRELLLPAEIRPDDVTAEQRNGLLWINLPLRDIP